LTKFIFVTGGVLSGLGKGLVTCSIGKSLQVRGFDVSAVKCDPYINVDAGTMNPYIHGEVFVLDDGYEADMDLGTYERFLGIELTHLTSAPASRSSPTSPTRSNDSSASSPRRLRPMCS